MPTAFQAAARSIVAFHLRAPAVMPMPRTSLLSMLDQAVFVASAMAAVAACAGYAASNIRSHGMMRAERRSLPMPPHAHV